MIRAEQVMVAVIEKVKQGPLKSQPANQIDRQIDRHARGVTELVEGGREEAAVSWPLLLSQLVRLFISSDPGGESMW